MAERPITINSTEYPNASFNRPADIPKNDLKQTPAKVEQVVDKDDVIVKKQSAWRKAKHRIVNEDGKKIKNYLVNTVLVPTFKTVVMNVVSIILYGDAKYANGTRSIFDSERSTPYVKYRAAGDIKYRSYSSNSAPSTASVRDRLELDSFIFKTRYKADKVLTELCRALDTRPYVSVATLYSICGMTCPYTYNDFVWTDLSEADIKDIPEGYLLYLPDPMLADER
jgi:hypothetical protein